MYEWLQNDPRPELKQDNWAWEKLLRLVPTLEDKQTASDILKNLWTFRSAGTMLKPGNDGLRFVPIIGGQGNFWTDEIEFDDMKKRHLGSYSKEISELLRKVMSS